MVIAEIAIIKTIKASGNNCLLKFKPNVISVMTKAIKITFWLPEYSIMLNVLFLLILSVNCNVSTI